MEQQTLWMVVAVPLGLAAVVTAVYLSIKSPGRALVQRRFRMRALAERLGMGFCAESESEQLARLPALGRLGFDDRRTAANLIVERRVPPRFALFDLQLTAFRGRLAAYPRASLLYLAAVAGLRADEPAAALRVYRDDWFGGPIGVEGLYRMEFDDDPEFCRRYRLAGEPREGARAVLTEPVRRAVGGWTLKGPRPVVQIQPGWVVVHVESDIYDRRAADRAEALLEYAKGIASAVEHGRRAEA